MSVLGAALYGFGFIVVVIAVNMALNFRQPSTKEK